MSKVDTRQTNCINGELLIIKSFSKFVKSYEHHAALQKSMAKRLAVFLEGEQAKTILEIGCGTGFFTKYLLALPFQNLILNDLSNAMINLLRQNIDLPKNVTLSIGNAERLIFSQTDLIVANAVFQWFQNPTQTLIGFSNIMNENGKLIFSVFGPKTLKELRKISRVNSPTKLLTQSGWEKIITKAGLRIVKAESELRKITFPSALALIRNLQQSGTAPTQLLNTGKLRKVIRQYDKIFTSNQGVYSTWEIYYFHAQKFIV